MSMSFLQHLNSTTVLNSAIGAILVIITSIMAQRIFQYGDDLAKIRSDVSHWREEQVQLRTHVRDFYRLTDSGKDFKIRDNQIIDLQRQLEVLEQRLLNLERVAINFLPRDAREDNDALNRLPPFLPNPPNQ